ncbi:hypothetical protein PFLUV_G00270770 [Perca fluviatilis]|uniref:Uncharacterized protein n=1 Tax=Perca fluviatilis TaxID=8168 RepID=A0A6A5DMR5_PERFL|nr:hypothetical protein PFLUV_G00270770 [Perca fluviatilis]
MWIKYCPISTAQLEFIPNTFDGGQKTELQAKLSPPQASCRTGSRASGTSPRCHVAYVSPTIKGSAPTPASTSLQCLNISGWGGGSGVITGIPMLCGAGAPTSTPNTPRSGLPCPASFVGTPSSTPPSPPSKGQPAQSFQRACPPSDSLGTAAGGAGCY